MRWADFNLYVGQMLSITECEPAASSSMAVRTTITDHCDTEGYLRTGRLFWFSGLSADFWRFILEEEVVEEFLLIFNKTEKSP